MQITKKLFKEYTGREPENDDLERCNCKKAGLLGHQQCGWCKVRNIPVYECYQCSKVYVHGGKHEDWDKELKRWKNENNRNI